MSDRLAAADLDARWEALTRDDREALLVHGHRQAPWESVPDTVRRLLLCDPKMPLEGVRTIDAIFRAAYAELASPA